MLWQSNAKSNKFYFYFFMGQDESEEGGRSELTYTQERKANINFYGSVHTNRDKQILLGIPLTNLVNISPLHVLSIVIMLSKNTSQVLS